MTYSWVGLQNQISPIIRCHIFLSEIKVIFIAVPTICFLYGLHLEEIMDTNNDDPHWLHFFKRQQFARPWHQTSSEQVPSPFLVEARSGWHLATCTAHNCSTQIGPCLNICSILIKVFFRVYDTVTSGAFGDGQRGHLAWSLSSHGLSHSVAWARDVEEWHCRRLVSCWECVVCWTGVWWFIVIV